MAFLSISDRKKWNRKIKKCAVPEVKIVRAWTRTISFFTPPWKRSFLQTWRIVRVSLSSFFGMSLYDFEKNYIRDRTFFFEECVLEDMLRCI